MSLAYPTADELLELSYGNPVPEAFFGMVQEVLGTLGQLDLTLTNATTIKAIAGTGRDKAGIGVGGPLRTNEANTEQAMPGGATAGRYTIYVTTGETLISGVEDSTDYSWQLAIVKEGGAAPSTAHYKVVGYLDFSGTAITRIVQTHGRRDDAPRAAVSPNVNVPALEAIMPASAVANGIQMSTGGTPVFTVGPSGAVTSSAGFSGQAATLAKNDRSALVLSGAASGMTLGGDTQLYRSAANLLASPGSMAVGGYLQANQEAYVGGKLNFGAFGGTSFDTVLERTATGTLKTLGAFQVGANLLLTTNGGSLLFGASADANLYRTGAGALKTDGSLTVGANLNASGEVALATTKLGFFAGTPVTQRAGWGAPSPPGGANRSVLTYASTLKNVIDQLETLKGDLRAYNFLGA